MFWCQSVDPQLAESNECVNDRGLKLYHDPGHVKKDTFICRELTLQWQYNTSLSLSLSLLILRFTLRVVDFSFRTVAIAVKPTCEAQFNFVEASDVTKNKKQTF